MPTKCLLRIVKVNASIIATIGCFCWLSSTAIAQQATPKPIPVSPASGLSVAVHFPDAFKNFFIAESKLCARTLAMAKGIFGDSNVWEIKKLEKVNTAAVILIPNITYQSRPSPAGKKKVETEITLGWSFFGGCMDTILAKVSAKGVATGKAKEHIACYNAAIDQAFVNSQAVISAIPEAASWMARQQIFYAIKADDREKLSLLLEEGLSTNVTSRQGDTPLMLACYFGKPATAKLLLEKGANPNAANRNSVTPLMLATSSGNIELVASLLEAGADATVQLPEGVNCQTIAQLKNFSEISKLITERTGMLPPAEEVITEFELKQKITPFLELFPPEKWLPDASTREEMVLTNKELEARNPRPAYSSPFGRRNSSPSYSSGVSLMESRDSKTTLGEKYSGYWEQGKLVYVSYYRQKKQSDNRWGVIAYTARGSGLEVGGVGIYLKEEASFDIEKSIESIWFMGEKTSLDHLASFDFKTISIERQGHAGEERYRRTETGMWLKEKKADMSRLKIQLW